MRALDRNIRIVGNLVVPALSAEVRQVLERDLSAGGHVDELIPLAELQTEVVSVLVQVTSGRRTVTVVLVVRAADTVAESGEWTTNSRSRRAADGPGSAITIEGSSEDGKENSENGTHSNALCGSVDELWDGGISVVWEETVVCHGVPKSKIRHVFVKWLLMKLTGPGTIHEDRHPQGQEQRIHVRFPRRHR